MSLLNAARSRQGLAVMATFCMTSLGLAAARPVMIFAINHTALAASGVRIVSAQSLWIDPIGLVTGQLHLTASHLVVGHRLIDSNLAFDSFAFDKDMVQGRGQMRFAFGPYQGQLRFARSGQAQQWDGDVGGGAQGHVLLHATRSDQGDLGFRVTGTHSAPLLAALLVRPSRDLSHLPDAIDLSLTQDGPHGAQLLSYRLTAQAFTASGQGQRDAARNSIRHQGKLQISAWPASAATNTDPYAALREQMGLLADGVARLRTMDVDIGLALAAPDGAHYALKLTKQASPGSALRFALARGDGPPAPPLIDLTFLAPQAGQRLRSSGMLGLWATPRPFGLTIEGDPGKPVSGMAMGLGGSLQSPDLRLHAQARTLFFSRSTALAVMAHGRLALGPISPALPAQWTSMAQQVGAATHGAPSLQIDSALRLEPARILIDKADLAGGPLRLAIKGKVEGGATTLDLHGHLPLVTAPWLASMGELAKAGGGSHGPSSGPMSIHAQIDVDRLDFAPLAFDGASLTYDSGQDARLHFNSASLSGHRLVTDGQMTLPATLRAAQAISATAHTPYGGASLSFRPNAAGPLAESLHKGGQISGQWPGLRVAGVLAGTQEGALHLTLVSDPLSQIKALRDLLGSESQYLPDETVNGEIDLTMAHGLRSATLTSRTLSATLRPREDGAMTFAIEGKAATVLQNVSSAKGLFAADTPLHLAGTMTQSNRDTQLSDLVVRLGDVQAKGAARIMAASRIDAQMVIEAKRAESVMRLFPNLLAIVPASMMDNPVSVPVHVQGDAQKMDLAAQDARIGGVRFTTALSAAGDGALTGRVRVEGPIAQMMMAGAPGWLRDLMGRQQAIDSQVTLTPHRLLRLSDLRLDGDRMGMTGDIVIPLRDGNFDFPATQGQVTGLLRDAHYELLGFPTIRFQSSLGSADKTAHVVFAMAGGGQAVADVTVSHQAVGGVNAHAKLSLRDVDLGALARDTGMRFFGSGRLNADMDAALPAEIFRTTSTTDALGRMMAQAGSGGGHIEIANGTLSNVSFADQAKNGSGGVAQGRSTAFREIRGQLVLNHGLLELREGHVAAQDFNLDADGTIKVPAMEMNLTMKGKIALVSGVNSGKALISSAFPPLHIAGTFDRPTYDFGKGSASVIRTAIGVVNQIDHVSKKLEVIDQSISTTVNRRFFDKVLPKKARSVTHTGPLPAGVD